MAKAVGRYRILALCSLVQLLGSWNLVNHSVFLAQWAHKLQANNTQLMLIFALHNVTFGLFSAAVAPTAERIGYRATILLGLLLLAASYAGGGALNFASVWTMLFWLGFLVGLGAALTCIAAAALSALVLDDQPRLWSVMITVSQLVGAALRVPLLRALLDRFGSFQALLAWSFVPLLCALGTLPFLREPPSKLLRESNVGQKREKVCTAPLVLFLVGLTLMASFGIARDLSPKYAESELGMSGPVATWAASTAFTASLVAVLLLLAAQRFVHTDGVMLSVLAVAALSVFAMALTSNRQWFAVLLSLFAASSSVAWALFPAALAERVSQVPRAYGAAYGVWALASACWGVVSGVVVDVTGTVRVYYLLSGVLLVGACIAFGASLLCLHRRGRKSESQVPLGRLLREVETSAQNFLESR